jgi:hypothetical protein
MAADFDFFIGLGLTTLAVVSTVTAGSCCTSCANEGPRQEESEAATLHAIKKRKRITNSARDHRTDTQHQPGDEANVKARGEGIACWRKTPQTRGEIPAHHTSGQRLSMLGTK